VEKFYGESVTAQGFCAALSFSAHCSSYKGFTNEKKIYFFYLAQTFFSFRVVLKLRGKIVPPPIMAWSKIFFYKILIFWHNYQRNNTNFKIKAKKSHFCAPLRSVLWRVRFRFNRYVASPWKGTCQCHILILPTLQILIHRKFRRMKTILLL
jgi:hypothetical protein